MNVESKSALKPTRMLVQGKFTNTVVLDLFYFLINLKNMTYSQQKQWLTALMIFSLEDGGAHPPRKACQNLGGSVSWKVPIGKVKLIPRYVPTYDASKRRNSALLFCVSLGVLNAGGWRRECFPRNQSLCYLQLCYLSASLHMPMPSSLWCWPTLHFCSSLGLAPSCCHSRHAGKETPSPHSCPVPIEYSHSRVAWASGDTVSFSRPPFLAPRHSGVGVVLDSGGVRLSITLQPTWKHCFLWYQAFCWLWFFLLDLFVTASDFQGPISASWLPTLNPQAVRLPCYFISDPQVVDKIQILFLWPNQMTSIRLSQTFQDH